MYSRKDVFGERPSHGIIAGVLLSVAVVAFGWAGMFAYNLSNNAQKDISRIVHQADGMVKAAGITLAKADHLPTRVATKAEQK